MKKLLMILMLALLSTSVYSQQTQNINVTAQVYTPLGLSVVSNLDFGGLIAGQTKSVLKTESSAGIVEIDGTTPVGVDVEFTLPTHLVSSGTDSLSVSFNTTNAGYNTINQTSGITDFDPNVGVTATLSPVGILYVYLGGSVTASPTQPTGIYSGTAILTVSYN